VVFRSIYRDTFLGVVLLLFVGTNLLAQQTDIADQPFRAGNTLPEDLLKSKVAVFMELPKNSITGSPQWEKLAGQLHETLRLNGVDAVAYYRWQDLTAGADATNGFISDISNRGIKNVIVFRIKPEKSEYQLMVVPFDPENNFYNSSQVTWGATDSELESLLRGLAFDLSQSGLVRENFLITELPEFFTDTKIFRNRRFESFNPDLKLDKLAVPEMSSQASVSTDTVISTSDQQLRTIMEQYPFAFEMVDNQRDEDLLRKAGFQFILLRLHSSGHALQTLLDYPASEGDSLLSIRRSPDGSFSQPIAKDQPVYKYYIKHIYTGDVYLGDQWDGDPQWTVALENHFLNLKAALKVKEN